MYWFLIGLDSSWSLTSLDPTVLWMVWIYQVSGCWGSKRSLFWCAHSPSRLCMFLQTTSPTSLSCWGPYHASLPSLGETPRNTSTEKVFFFLASTRIPIYSTFSDLKLCKENTFISIYETSQYQCFKLIFLNHSFYASWQCSSQLFHVAVGWPLANPGAKISSSSALFGDLWSLFFQLITFQWISLGFKLRDHQILQWVWCVWMKDHQEYQF